MNEEFKETHSKLPPNTRRLRVLTFNIFAGKLRVDEKRVKAQIQKIISLDCDVMCFQEAWDRRVIELYKETLRGDYDIITCNSNLSGEEHQTLLLGRGGFCQRLCELLLPLAALLGTSALILLYFLYPKIVPSFFVLLAFMLQVILSLLLAVFAGSILKYIWRCCRLPQHGFITGDIMGLMIAVRKGKNCSGAEIHYVENSSFAEVFSKQAAKRAWRLFGFVERFFIVKGYLSLDFRVDQHKVGVTNIHFNTGTKNICRMGQIFELFRKAVSPNHPAFLCGDANTEDDQPEIKWIAGRMADTYKVFRNDKLRRASRGDGFTWHNDNPLTHQGFLVDKNMRIDYIWFRNKANGRDLDEEIIPPLESVGEDPFVVHNSSVVMDQKPCTSDHFGVMTELWYKTDDI